MLFSTILVCAFNFFITYAKISMFLITSGFIHLQAWISTMLCHSKPSKSWGTVVATTKPVHVILWKKCLTYTYIFSSNYQVLKPPLKRNTFDISFHGQQNLENSYGMNLKFKCFLPILIYKFEIFISHMFAITYSYLMMIQYIKSDDDSCHLLVI
jgi:hypothetical protein